MHLKPNLAIRRTFLLFALALCTMAIAFPTSTFSCDIEVDQNDPAATYQTIQEGLEAAIDGQIICVHPGTYVESVTVEKSVTLRAVEGPALTIIQSTTPGTGLPGIKIRSGANPRIIGFQIREFHNGLELLSDADDVLIANNIFAWNGNYGIALGPDTATTTAIINNTFANQTAAAIHTSGLEIELVDFYNCLFYENDPTETVSQWDVDVVSLGGFNLSDRNVTFAANGGPSFLEDVDPLIDPNNAYRFTSETSPAIDAGKPTAKNRDPDGTVSDIGAWGGRYSRGWYRGPTGGPTLQDVSLFRNQVQPGETITIRATAKTD